jgi:hypothetical protein
MKKFFFILLIIIITGCANKIPQPDNTAFIKMGIKVPGMTLEIGIKGY